MLHYTSFITSIIKRSGTKILESYGPVLESMQKDDPSQIVTDLDLFAEKLISDEIIKAFPEHSILAEESGFLDKQSQYTWIIDPIDGTSNFAVGLPWFGVMIALLKDTTPIASGIYLPVLDQLFTAEKDNGALYNGKPVQQSASFTLKESLISFCSDPSTDESHTNKLTTIFSSLLPNVRNIRATNSAVDYAYAAIGRLGGLISFKNKLWDVAPVALLASEAGQIVTDSTGIPLSFAITPEHLLDNYTLLIARPTLHAELLSLIQHS